MIHQPKHHTRLPRDHAERTPFAWLQWVAFPAVWFLLLGVSQFSGVAHGVVVWLMSLPGVVVFVVCIPVFSTLGWWLARRVERSREPPATRGET